LPALLDATIESGHRGQFHETTRVRLAERFQWALAPALLCLFISFWREFPVRPRARDLKLEPESRNQRSDGRGQKTENISAGASVAALCLLFSCFCFPSPARAGNEAPAEPLTKVVGHLSAQDSSTAQDWADLAQTTVNYGQRLKGEQQPVPAGTVRDALAAVDSGEALDARAADWPKLRRDLEALQKKPPEQKPPPQQQQKQPQQSQKNDSDKNQQNSQQNQSSGGKSQPDKSSQSQKNNSGNSQQQSQQDQSSNGQPQQNSPSPGSLQNQPPNGPSAFGDMKEKSPTPTQSEPSTASTRELQKFGGVPEQKIPDAAANDPALAVPLQKLDQLKQQDSPAALYQLLRGENKPPTASNGKDW